MLVQKMESQLARERGMLADKVTLAYWAGVFDYSGFIGMHKAGRKYRYPHISLTSKIPHELAKLERMFGGKMRYTKQNQNYTWERTGAGAQIILGRLAPYMNNRKDMLMEALRWRPTKPGRKTGMPVKPRIVRGSAMSGSSDVGTREFKGIAERA